MKPVCDKWGLTRFESEPFTDVKIIREKTEIICMNFGNGGYLAHSDTEYFIMEDMDHALGMGKELIDSLGYTRFTLTNVSQYASTQAVFKASDGEGYIFPNYNDSISLEKLGKYAYAYRNTSYTNKSTFQTTAQSKNKDDINEKGEALNHTLSIKFIFYFIFSSLLLLFFWYYLSIFGAVYINTQYHLLKDTLVSFGLSLLYPLGICLLPGIFRIPALSDPKKKREYLYKFSKILQLL
jgi:hypothetical protein